MHNTLRPDQPSHRPRTHPSGHTGALTNTCRPRTSTATNPAKRNLFESLGGGGTVGARRPSAMLPFLPSGAAPPPPAPRTLNIPVLLSPRRSLPPSLGASLPAPPALPLPPSSPAPSS